MSNVLDQIMGVQEAGELWGLSPDRVKGLCQKGEVKAKKVGNSWVLDKNQPNPKGGKRKMYEEKFTVLVGSYDIFGDEVIKKEEILDDEEKAESLAKEWAKENSEVYIRYDRSADGQVSYLNPQGYELKAVDWSE